MFHVCLVPMFQADTVLLFPTQARKFQAITFFHLSILKGNSGLPTIDGLSST